ncbi:MAG TPA: efflux RND transporter permease subunit [Bryobacteraceae bacterium]|nr:efflux RND transporter permease subunit [Bryobacteraceae bacterium]
MNFSEIFIRRPIATSLLMLAIALFGMVAYRALPVSDLPNVDFPTLVVSATLPGANPDTMASAVATPLERQFSTIAGLDTMSSTSSLGVTQITLQFDLSRNLDGAAVDVQTGITQASPYLPQGMPTPPTFRKVNPADQPILYIALTSPTLPLYTVDEYAETTMAQRISMIAGVAQVSVFGAQKYAVHAQLDPHLLAAKQIGIDEVENAIEKWNVNLPTGTLYGTHNSFTVLATGQLMSAAEYGPLIVAYRNGAPVRLRELGRVIDSVEDDKTASWFYSKEVPGRRSMILAIQRQPGTNTIEVTDAIKRLLPLFKAQIPPSVELHILYDRSISIRASFQDVEFTLLLTLGLVIMVIFLFLRNLSATAIPSLALPFSVIGTFAVMFVLDFSLDNLSMMALILCVGFVVDDAIVMLENIVRHMEQGASPLEAAFEGSREIGFTIISMTLSLAAVFIPVLFMGGILGRLFKEFAVTICAAILISGFVSVTLTPMLCSRFLRVKHASERGALYRMTERFFDGMLRFYDRTLQAVLRYRPATMVVFFAILAGTGWLFVKIPKGFIPDQDTDQIFVVTEAAQGTSFEQMKKYQKLVSDVGISYPYVEEFMSSVGGTSAASLGGQNFGRMFFHLVPRSQRPLNVTQIMHELAPKLAGFPGIRVFMQNPPTIRIGGQLTKSLYQVTMQGPDTAELYRRALSMEREIARMPGLQDVNSDLQIKNPQIYIQIDRDKAAAVNVSAQQIENALYDSYGPRWISTIYAPINQYKVLIELLPQYQSTADAISLLYVRSGDGKLVPIDTVTHMIRDSGPQTINHFGQLPAVTLSFNLRPGASLGDAVSGIQTLINRLPASISATFQGTAKAFQSSLGNLWLLLAVAIMVVYIVLGILYESYIHPLTILSGLPSAGFGALLTLYIFHIELSIYAFVGLIMLIGIVKKNAIMQIDFALAAERNEGKSPRDAIYEGCLIRFRPIMMTTMAALLGAVPIALGYGAGGEARQPLGMAVVGGLLFSQLITLYLTPVVYTYLAGLTGDKERGAGPALQLEPSGARQENR